MQVLAFGEILWDIIEDSEYLGGAPFNFVAHMAQCGNNAFIISRIVIAINRKGADSVDVDFEEIIRSVKIKTLYDKAARVGNLDD